MATSLKRLHARQKLIDAEQRRINRLQRRLDRRQKLLDAKRHGLLHPYPEGILSPDMITSMALKTLHQKMDYLNSQPPVEYAAIGSTLRIRAPVNYTMQWGAAAPTDTP